MHDLRGGRCCGRSLVCNTRSSIRQRGGVRSSGDALAHARPKMKSDREIVLAAVAKSENATNYVGSFKADREVVLAMVKQNGNSLFYAAGSLKAEREFLSKKLGCAGKRGEEESRRGARCRTLVSSVSSTRQHVRRFLKVLPR